MKQNSGIVISLSHVSKKYTIHHEKPTLMEKLINRKNEEFWALKDINLEIKKGEKIGVIGPNGSGKTTLLKLITGISSPTVGKIKTKGNIVSLIDIEAGFHPDLTGIQNIYLNGMILGMSKSEIKQKLNDIIAFADIGKFIDVPIFTYSEGMKLRLGFSVAINSDPDVLILDEGITAGDEDFRKKAVEKTRELFKQNKTILIASHWFEFIKSNCTKLIIFNKGRVEYFGPIARINKYIHR